MDLRISRERLSIPAPFWEIWTSGEPIWVIPFRLYCLSISALYLMWQWAPTGVLIRSNLKVLWVHIYISESCCLCEFCQEILADWKACSFGWSFDFHISHMTRGAQGKGQNSFLSCKSSGTESFFAFVNRKYDFSSLNLKRRLNVERVCLLML